MYFRGNSWDVFLQAIPTCQYYRADDDFIENSRHVITYFLFWLLQKNPWVNFGSGNVTSQKPRADHPALNRLL
jgi:hypothetical protein